MKTESSTAIRERINSMHVENCHLWGLYDLHRAASAKLEKMHRDFTRRAACVYPGGEGGLALNGLFQAAMQEYSDGELERVTFCIAACESDPHWQSAVALMQPVYDELAAALEREEKEKAALEIEKQRLAEEFAAEQAAAEAAIAAAQEKALAKPNMLREKLAGLAARVAGIGS